MITEDIWCDHATDGNVWFKHQWLTCVDRNGNDCMPNHNDPVDGFHGYYSEKVVDRYFHRDKCTPCSGNPIYPLTGIKSQPVSIDGVFGAEFGLTYENREALPFDEASKAEAGGVADHLPQEFGQLWHGGSHKRLRTQTTDAGILVTVLADRGGNDWQTFWKDGSLVPAEPQNNNKLTVVTNGYRLTDVQNSTLEVYTNDGQLQEQWSATGGKRNYVYSTQAVPGVSTAAGQLLNVVDQFDRSVGYKYEADRVYRIVRQDNVEIPVNYEGGNLSALVWPDSSTKRFVYEHPVLSGLLTGIVDEEDKRYATFGYDNAGLATSTEHAGGVYKFVSSWTVPPTRHVTSFHSTQWNLRLRDHTWTLPVTASLSEPSGNSATIRSKLIQGMPRQTERSEGAGSGHDGSKKYLDYDSRGNIVSEIDFTGNRTCIGYESGRNFETVRVEGLRIEDYPKDVACPDPWSYKVAAGKSQRKVTTAWHPVWKLQTQRAEPKRIITTIYNGQRDVLDLPNQPTLNCAPDAPLLPDGNKIAVVCKRYEQSTDDDTGNLGLVAVATKSRSWSYEYNQYGQVTTEIDPRGKQTTYEYYPQTTFAGDGNAARGHWKGDLQRVTNALQQQTEYLEYNKRGQPLTIKYANGSQEWREYHVRGWLSKVTLVPADNKPPQVTKYDYWKTGLLKQVTQPDGSFATYDWDDAHRLAKVTDSIGNKVEYELDNEGNRKTEKFSDPNDVLAKTISRTFDALGRMKSSTGVQ